jgi:peptidoglycan/xylan/chitin deacetylase (PgdA/CDA1 family)
VPTPVRTPPDLPGTFQSQYLNPLDAPHTYVADTCQYLKNKWDPNKAAPGTVVMPIMFHSITKGEVTNYDQISINEFHTLMADLKEQGFEAITTEQLADFLENNTRIPWRSVYLVVDDRKQRAYFDTTFKEYNVKWGWKVVNAWISAPDNTYDVWGQNAQLEAEGWVDHQAHGVVHNIPMADTSTEAYITSELQGSIDALRKKFNKTPIAIIWPGGGFGTKPVQIARQLGYRLGFTINPRGPLMYNWIPLSDKPDTMRPSYLPEGSINDPLMVLPRFWDTDARSHIDRVRLTGKEAAAYAEQNKATELAYYDILCAPTLGPIPTTAP